MKELGGAGEGEPGGDGEAEAIVIAVGREEGAEIGEGALAGDEEAVRGAAIHEHEADLREEAGLAGALERDARGGGGGRGGGHAGAAGHLGELAGDAGGSDPVVEIRYTLEG